MFSPESVIGPRISKAIVEAFGIEFADMDPVLRPSQYADVQSNVALPLAKRLGLPPRDVADRIVAHSDLADVSSACEVSGPGFINITVSANWLALSLTHMSRDGGHGVPRGGESVIPIDYSAPNVAKEMHVGHLRTTVVGDSLARVLERLGHRVIRQNHIGDWGTPFGMLIEQFVQNDLSSSESLIESDPNTFYQAARERFDNDPEFASRARRRVVLMQRGDDETLALWHRLVEISKKYFNRIYSTLDVSLTDDDLAGESTYNPYLEEICVDLERRGIASVSDGALCVFLDDFRGRDGKPVPLIIRKSDGGYGYATTDLATVRFRVEKLQADRILYVVGAPQAMHLAMVWATARMAGWLPQDVQVVHVQIGNVLGSDHKILRTRSGTPLRLMNLLEEAIERARNIVEEMRHDLSEAQKCTIAHQVGIGAVKYADLSVAHNSEYVFDLERMVSFTGNTGPYLQYAVARIRSIFRSAETQRPTTGNVLLVAEPAERTLALQLLGYGRVIQEVGEKLEPHRLCAYLYSLAQDFSRFYESCPVLRAEGDAYESRMSLCRLTHDVLVDGLALLGIAAPDHM